VSTLSGEDQREKATRALPKSLCVLNMSSIDQRRRSLVSGYKRIDTIMNVILFSALGLGYLALEGDIFPFTRDLEGYFIPILSAWIAVQVFITWKLKNRIFHLCGLRCTSCGKLPWPRYSKQALIDGACLKCGNSYA
jgi:hypothetical protein